MCNCNDCNTEINRGHTVNDTVVCDSCYDDNYFVCNNCSKTFDVDDSREDYNNDYVCEECYDETCTKCADCGDVIDINSEYSNASSEAICEDCSSNYRCYACGCNSSELIEVNQNNYCESCYDSSFHECSDCDEIISIHSARCSDCDDNYSFCSDCGEEYYNEDLNEDCLCESCQGSTVIKPYNYKPRNITFHGIGPYFMGVEIEVMPVDRDEASQQIQKIMEDFVYIKSDGSLDAAEFDKVEDGFEIVSHPASLDYHKEMWPKVLDKCKEIGIKSYGYDCCGLHVHASKKGLSELTIGKIVNFVNASDNHNFIVKLAQRECPDYAVLDDKPISHVLKYKKDRDSRYVAVNLQNEHTIELRIFKGNLDKRAFFRAIEFTEAIQIFCKNTSNRELHWKNFVDFVFKNKKRYINLHEFCDLFVKEQDEPNGGDIEIDNTNKKEYLDNNGYRYDINGN